MLVNPLLRNLSEDQIARIENRVRYNTRFDVRSTWGINPDWTPEIALSNMRADETAFRDSLIDVGEPYPDDDTILGVEDTIQEAEYLLSWGRMVEEGFIEGEGASFAISDAERMLDTLYAR